MKFNAKLIEKINKLLDREIAKEKDKFMSGNKNNFYTILDDVAEIKEHLTQHDAVYLELDYLRRRVRELEDKYMGRN